MVRRSATCSITQTCVRTNGRGRMRTARSWSSLHRHQDRRLGRSQRGWPQRGARPHLAQSLGAGVQWMRGTLQRAGRPLGADAAGLAARSAPTGYRPCSEETARTASTAGSCQSSRSTWEPASPSWSRRTSRSTWPRRSKPARLSDDRRSRRAWDPEGTLPLPQVPTSTGGRWTAAASPRDSQGFPRCRPTTVTPSIRAAYAARTTSSFPGAFEPASFYSTPPHLVSDATAGETTRQNLHGVFSETTGLSVDNQSLAEEATGEPASMSVFDGGVFDNIPIVRALDDISDMPADTAVDRRLFDPDPAPADPRATAGCR